MEFFPRATLLSVALGGRSGRGAGFGGAGAWGLCARSKFAPCLVLARGRGDDRRRGNARGGSAGGDDAEAVVEDVSVLDGGRLGEAAGGDCEAVEETDAAEQDEAVTVPVFDETDQRLPLAPLVGTGVMVVPRTSPPWLPSWRQ